ncbi:MAG: tetratricopeptide repeat protein [Methylovirgula sp.]
MRVTACLLLACTLFALVGLQSAHAEPSPQWHLCTGDRDVEWDRQITACTALIETGKETRDKQAAAYNNRGVAYAAKGDLDRAIADFDQAIRLDPKDEVAYKNRGGAYKAKGDFDRAIADYSEAIRLDPKDVLAYKNRGIAYLYSRALPKALADFNLASETDPKNAYTALWVEIVSKRSNLPSRLADAAKRIDMTKWPAPVIRLYLGQSTWPAVLAAADDSDANTKKGEVCEANFYGGELALQGGRKDEAKHLIGLAAEDCPKTFLEYDSAKAELEALAANQ